MLVRRSAPPSRLRAFLLHFLVLSLLVSCGKSASTANGATATAGKGAVVEDAAALVVKDGVGSDLWVRAKENLATGDGDDLARLADREGMNGILAKADDPAWRATAIHALAYVDGFDALPWLAKVAKAEPNDDAMAALDSAIDIAARPRRAVDPEDAEEMREGCDALLALAKEKEAARPRRILAIRALRMLSDRGCVAPNDIPTDLDAR